MVDREKRRPMKTIGLFVGLAIAVAVGYSAPSAAGRDGGCMITSSTAEGGLGSSSGDATAVTGTCVRSVGTSSAGTLLPMKTIVCGSPSSLDNGFWDPRCGTMMRCPTGLAFATLAQQSGKWVLLDTWCPSQAKPVVTTAALRQQVLRLLPTVRIGSAWTTRALVNAETILWAETSARRSLGTVTVVGRQVGLRIAFDHADWSFGDSATDTTTDPGRPYSKSDPCETAQCAGYYGHTYTDTGPVTITLSVAWHAEFSLDNGTTWTAVDPAPLTGPSTTHDLTVVQARGIIVQDQ